jgi:hypothetical protein
MVFKVMNLWYKRRKRTAQKQPVSNTQKPGLLVPGRRRPVCPRRPRNGVERREEPYRPTLSLRFHLHRAKNAMNPTNPKKSSSTPAYLISNPSVQE